MCSRRMNRWTLAAALCATVVAWAQSSAAQDAASPPALDWWEVPTDTATQAPPPEVPPPPPAAPEVPLFAAPEVPLPPLPPPPPPPREPTVWADQSPLESHVLHGPAAHGAADYVLEALGGLGGYAASAAVVGLGLLALEDGGEAGGALVGLGVLSLPFMITTGIYAVGNSRGGHGGFGYTFLGQALGGLVSMMLMFASFNRGSDDAWLTASIAGVIVLPLIGGVMGYELSSH